MAQPEKKTAKTLVLEHTLKSVVALNGLIVEAMKCKNLQALKFHILNSSVKYIHYDRAILIDNTNKRILGMSGSAKLPKHSKLLSEIKKIFKGLKDTSELQIIAEDSLRSNQGIWLEYKETNNKTAILLIPLQTGNKSDCKILWLERWEGKSWRDSDIKFGKTLKDGMENCWALLSKSKEKGGKKKGLKKCLILVFLIALILAMQAVKISERIVAPCEVVPKDPDSVTAVIDGVIDRVLVEPGDIVHDGERLVQLNSEVYSEEYNAAMQQMRIVASELSRTEALAVSDKYARGGLKSLQSSLLKEKARVSIAKYRLDNSVITSSVDGVVMMGDPQDWEGRPVQTGERIMLIINPDVNKVKIYLPLDDKVDFPEGAAVKVVLNTDSALSREAHLTYLSEHATQSSSGEPCFLAEAEFDKVATGMRIGVQGSAIVYGKRVSLGYWLIRRPLAWLRTALGV